MLVLWHCGTVFVSVEMRRSDRFLFAVGALAIAVYFFRLTRPALHVYLSPDD